MADLPDRSTSFAKTLDPEPPSQTARPEFNRQADTQREPAIVTQTTPPPQLETNRSSFAKSLDHAPPQLTVRPDFNRQADKPSERLSRGSEMVQKDRPSSVLAPDAATREQPDRQSYNARLNMERLIERNRAAVARAKSVSKTKDRGMERD